MIFISFFLKIMLESKFGSPINSFLSILFDFVLIEVLPTSFFDLNISNSQCAECQFSTIADNMWVTGTVKDNKYLVVDLVPDPSKTSAYGGKEIIYKKFGSKYEGPVNFAETLGKLAPGKHALKMVVNCYYAPVATGELTLTGDDFSPYTTLAEQLNNTAASAGAASAEFPKAVATDPARVTRMIAALKNSNDWKNGRFDATEILKTAITYDWEIRRHEISGAILHRYCIAAVAVKTKSGECAYYKVTFQEDYAGGKFQPLRYDGAGDKVVLKCAKVR